MLTLLKTLTYTITANISMSFFFSIRYTLISEKVKTLLNLMNKLGGVLVKASG